MAIKVGEKDLFPYLGDYGPVSICKGEQKLAGYKWAEKSGQELHFDNTYNSHVEVEVDGQSYQHAEPTPDYPIEIHSLNNFDVVSSVEKLSEGQLQEYDYDVEYKNVDKVNLLLSEPLRSVGDVHDRLFKDGDGVWKVERNVGEATFDGTEDWSVWYSRDTSSMFGLHSESLEEPMLKTSGLVVSNMFPTIINVNVRDEEGTHIGTRPRLRVRAFYERVGTTLNSTKDEKINSFKQWLSNAYTEGVPLTIVYEVETPSIETLDQELQDQLNTLKSFKGSNYVYTVQNTDNPHKEQLKPTIHAKTEVKDI